MNACTVIAGNYLAYARVLAESFRSHHAQGRFSVLLLDDPGFQLPADGEAFHLVRPQDIMDPQEFNRLSLIYDVTELATAVKPWLLRHLLKDGQPEVVFFDPDIQIFSPLDDIAELARRHSIVLTPHDVEPMPRDRSSPSEIQVLQSGAYNLGFIAVGSGAASFLDWWAERLRRHCVSAPEQGLFVDQRWIDFVPGYFDHFILKDPGCNVAYWNLSNRNLIWNGVRYVVNGEELRFFHFSGFDPERPHLLSRHSLPSPRVLLSEHPALRRICQAYAKELLARGHRSLSRKPYGLGSLENGLRIDRRMRWIYREALLAFEQRKGEEPPAANGDPDALVRWFNEPVVRSPGVSRYLHSVYSERLDLQLAFPDLSGNDGERYLTWVRETGVKEARIPGAFLPPSTPSAPSETTTCASAKAPSDRLLLPGVNVVGYFRAELGVGEAARQLVAALEQVGVPYATVTLEDTAHRQEHPFEAFEAIEDAHADTPYDVNIICVNADMLPGCAKKLGREFFDRRYTIGLWHWEVSAFPKEWHGSFAHLDEIWVASEYTAAALSPVSPKPVHVIPPPVTPPLSSNSMRAELGLPEGFLFLFIYDFMSVFRRKNPLALIEAFGRAFAPGEGPVLVLKSINGETRIEDLEQVKVSAAEHPDVLVIDRYFSRESMIGLISSCDCYVSLHRAEGFGLTMAEAMVAGKPVIATGFSGNLTFMSEENAYLVRHEVVPIPEGCEPYPAGGEWAEPDIEDAARLMRHVYEQPGDALEKGRRARKDLLDRDRPSVRAELIGRRLSEIRQARAAARSEGQQAAPEPAATEPAAPQPPESQAAELAPSGPSTHDRAYFRSMEFPGNPWEATIRFRPLLPLARSLLFRLLRPYTVGLAAFHKAILQESLELGQRIDSIEREAIPALRNEVRERDGAILAVVREFAQRVDALERERIPAILDEVGEERKRAGDRLASMKKRVGLIEEKMGQAFGRHGDIERHLAKLVTNVSEFQDAAKAHLASLTASVSSGERTLERLSRELYALPHTAEPMRIRAADGRECIGYDGNQGSSTPVDVYPSFEDSFRGPEAFIKDRLRVYLDLARDKQPVVDIGCGRGEFLDLLAESGFSGVGVDVNPGMVERCRRRGHEVELADAADYLAARADGSIGCIFSAHLIEHLPFESLLAIIRLSRSKLSRNGLFIAETVNPHSIAAMKNFWVDLTHRKPIFPEVAVTLCRLLAFESARIFFPRGNGNLEEDLWQQGEYAVVASAS